MSIKPINHYSLTNPASIYDEEALTALELAARTAGKVNEVIDDNEKFKIESQKINDNLLREFDAKNEEYKQDLINANYEFTSQVINEVNSVKDYILARFANKTVYDFTDTFGNHSETEIPPIYQKDESNIYIREGVYHVSGGNTILRNAETLPIPTGDTTPKMYYLVRSSLLDDAQFALKTSAQIIYSDILFCGVYYQPGDIKPKLTFHNDALFCRYNMREAINIAIDGIKKDTYHYGYVHSGTIVLDTEAKTIEVREPLLVTVPRFSGFVTVPVSDPADYTLPDGVIGTFMFSIPVTSNDHSPLSFGLVSDITKVGKINIYLGAYGYGKLIGNNFANNVVFIIDGETFLAGNIKSDSSFIPDSISNLLELNKEDYDIVIPSRICLPNDYNPLIFDMANLSKYKGKYFLSASYDSPFSQMSFKPNLNVPDDLEFSFIRSDLSGHILERKNITLSIRNAPAIETPLKVMLLGDDLFDNGFVLKAISTIPNIQLVGTRERTTTEGTIKHEGRFSWGWLEYNNLDEYEGKTNPFRNNGALDIANYVSFSGITQLDYMFICLGTNDVGLGTPNLGSIISNRYKNAISYAKNFISAILSANIPGWSNLKICLILPNTGRNEFYATYINPDTLHYAIQMLNQNYVTSFENNENFPVSLIPWNFFTKDDDLIDSIHPNSNGAEKLKTLIKGYIYYDKSEVV